MKQSYKWIFALLLSIFFLQGCSQSLNAEVVEEAIDAPSTKEVAKTEGTSFEEVTLKVEDYIIGNSHTYHFNGFIGEDTLVFQSQNNVDDSEVLNIYHPAKVGYTFTFKNMGKIVEAEIINFDRTPGYITLKLEMKQ